MFLAPELNFPREITSQIILNYLTSIYAMLSVRGEYVLNLNLTKLNLSQKMLADTKHKRALIVFPIESHGYSLDHTECLAQGKPYSVSIHSYF